MNETPDMTREVIPELGSQVGKYACPGCCREGRDQSQLIKVCRKGCRDHHQQDYFLRGKGMPCPWLILGHPQCSFGCCFGASGMSSEVGRQMNILRGWRVSVWHSGLVNKA